MRQYESIQLWTLHPTPSQTLGIKDQRARKKTHMAASSRKSDWDFELETNSISSNRYQEHEVQEIRYLPRNLRTKVESKAKGIQSNPIAEVLLSPHLKETRRFALPTQENKTASLRLLIPINPHLGCAPTQSGLTGDVKAWDSSSGQRKREIKELKFLSPPDSKNSK
jgi:hypothetical protein